MSTDEPIGTDRVLADIKRKRQRQVVVHGYSRGIDDQYDQGELAEAAIPYIQAAYDSGLAPDEVLVFWPWDDRPPNLNQPPRELLLNAAALLVAEIERLDRKA